MCTLRENKRHSRSSSGGKYVGVANNGARTLKSLHNAARGLANGGWLVAGGWWAEVMNREHNTDSGAGNNVFNH